MQLTDEQKHWLSKLAHYIACAEEGLASVPREVLVNLRIFIATRDAGAQEPVGHVTHDDANGWDFRPAVDWTVLGKGRALYAQPMIEQAARREALRLALSEIACATSRSEAYKAIYALIEEEES